MESANYNNETRKYRPVSLLSCKRSVVVAISSTLFCVGCASGTSAAVGASTSQDLASLATLIDARLNEDPVAAYSEFQWSLWHGADLVLAPNGEYYYPAKVKPGEVLESYPPKLSVMFIASGQQSVREIGSLVSVKKTGEGGWALQVFHNEEWSASFDFEFDGQRFILPESKSISISEIATMRFVAINPN